MAELDTEPSGRQVARLYARWVGTLVIDAADATKPTPRSRPKGLKCVVAPTVMRSPEKAVAAGPERVDAATVKRLIALIPLRASARFRRVTTWAALGRRGFPGRQPS